MKSRKKVKKNKFLRWMIILLFLGCVVTVTTFCYSRYKEMERQSVRDEDVSAFDASLKEQEVEETGDTIYMMTDADMAFQKETVQQFEDHMQSQNTSKSGKDAQHIIKALETGSDEEVEALLNRLVLVEKGYKYAYEPVKAIRQQYGIEKGISVIMPYSYVDFAGYTYCVARIAGRKQCSSGEMAVDYRNVSVITLTIYPDGSFLPFAVQAIGDTRNICICRE